MTNLMVEYDAKRLPVVDAENRPVGLVGRGRILQVFSRKMGK
jgi:CBS domain-containing protein